MSTNTDRDGLIIQLTDLTGLDPHLASQYLSSNEWNVEAAATEYYASLDEAESDVGESDSRGQEPVAGGGRTLDGSFAGTTAGSAPSPSSKPKSAQKKFATLGDLGGGSRGPSHDKDSDDDSDHDPQDLFAGGEKSGLAVQNPDDIKKKILDRARKGVGRPGGDDPTPSRSHFTGTAHTLGGDDMPSQVIEDPRAKLRSKGKRPEPVERHLHFWTDGFSIDDGPLYRNDDPQNTDYLQKIRRGEAPMQIMNVRPDQQVDVQVVQHDTPYVQPKKKYKPFDGGGQRLGSPVPGVESSGPQATPVAPATASSSSAPAVDVDNSQPTLSLQIRLGDGTRLVARFNTTHTIGDVYSFVNASSTSSQGRNWVLMTTFPSKELSNRSAVLGELGELKKGGTVIQKWA